MGCAFQCLFGYPQQRLQNNDDDGGLHPKKQGVHERHVAKGRVDGRQSENHNGAGYDEQKPGDQSAQNTVQAPTGICRQLHGFWAWQKHAEGEGVEKLLLFQPIQLINEHAMHEGDLGSGTAKGEQADFEEHHKGDAE